MWPITGADREAFAYELCMRFGTAALTFELGVGSDALLFGALTTRGAGVLTCGF